jgi:hypothetical protein
MQFTPVIKEQKKKSAAITKTIFLKFKNKQHNLIKHAYINLALINLLFCCVTNGQ